MKMKINKLPAVLLAVAMAALIVLAQGLVAQSYADEFEYTVDIIPREWQYTALPGQSIELNAAVYHDFDGDDPYDEAELDYKWVLDESDTEFAKLRVSADKPAQAYLVFKDMEPGADDFDALAGVTVFVYHNGKEVAMNSAVLQVSSDFYELYSDFPFDYQMINVEADFRAHLMHFDLAHPDGEDVKVLDWQFDYDDEDPVVEITKGETTDTELKFKVKRLSGDMGLVTLTAKYGESEDDAVSKFYWLERVPTDLNEYKVNLPDDLMHWQVFLDEEEVIPLDYLKNNVVVNYENVNLFPGEYIDLKIEKYDGFDEEAGEMVWVPYEGDLKFDPKGSPVDRNGEPTEGSAFFKISAVPKEGSVFTGETVDFAQYMFLFSTRSVTSNAAEITFNRSYWKVLDDDPFERYEVNEGTTLAPRVKLNEEVLEEGTQYTSVYVNDITGDITNDFPTEAGMYTFHIEGAGEYYGSSLPIAIKVGKDNFDFTAKGKTITVKIGKKKKTPKAKSFARSKAFKTSGNQGTISYEKASGNSKITVSSGGKITVKKGLKKGKYKIKVKVTDNETEQYFATTKTVTVTVKVVK